MIWTRDELGENPDSGCKGPLPTGPRGSGRSHGGQQTSEGTVTGTWSDVSVMTPLPELQQQAVSLTRTFTLRSPQGPLTSQSDHAQALGCLLQQQTPPELPKQTRKGGKGISKVHRSDCGNLSSLGCLGGSGAPGEYDSCGRRQRTVMGRVQAGSHLPLS